MTTPDRRSSGGIERRHDIDGRERIVQLEKRWRSTALHVWVAIVGLYIVAGFGIWNNHRASEDIQSSRTENVINSCQESNDRHDRTVAAFRHEFNQAVKDLPAAQRKIAAKQRDANIRLINVFIPVRKDSAGRSLCREYAERVTR